tara:strand:+ start:12270 stop:13001 length:732 start_codon:yes stop_codon:yes gene_type:complete
MGVLGSIGNAAKKLLGIKQKGGAPVGQVKPVEKKKVYDKLDDNAKLGLDAAAQAYEKADDRKDIGDYKYQREDSDLHNAVYHNSKTGHSYIGYRGTDPKDTNDLKLDLTAKTGNIVAGTQRKSDRYKASLEKYNKIKNKYGGEVGVSGHSLGGSISNYVSDQTGASSQVFNTGRGVDGTSLADRALCKLPKSLRPKGCGKTTRHRISRDPLSLMDRLVGDGGTTTYDGTGLGMNRHDLNNFYK